MLNFKILLIKLGMYVGKMLKNKGKKKFLGKKNEAVKGEV